MNITLICMGKTSFPFLHEGIVHYKTRVERYIKFKLIEIRDKKERGINPVNVIKREGETLLSSVSDSDFLILLDENGRKMTSEGMAKFINSKMNLPVKHIVFVIGGAFGFSEAVYKRANDSLSLSLLTFSHQLVRLIFMEQLYRAFTIIKGEPYHHS
jgi:23S rRNA (pseudouridine1915-N3)-methyltransferase